MSSAFSYSNVEFWGAIVHFVSARTYTILMDIGRGNFPTTTEQKTEGREKERESETKS